MQFNANDVLEIAKQIERNGEAFYRTAAKTLGQAEGGALLEELAAMEHSHLNTFQQIQDGLSEWLKQPEVFDPNDEASLYLQAFADGCVFDLDAKPAKFLETERGLDEILAKAIDLEKDSIAFYTGLREMVPADRGRSKVAQIILEEMSHVRLLAGKRKQLNG